jgi:isoleucyl-tRNA synthetase
VSLPITDFSQRANAVIREPEIQKFWTEAKIYEQLAEENTGEPFVLHDGPPYANGDLHIGHALNKILKDIINRYQMLKGRKVKYVPGWDCHGLPIELKVLQSMKQAERKELTPLDLRKKAASFATETVSKQRDSFKRYGVWADWEEPYMTLQPEYEAAQVGVFGDMFLKGYIYRGRKPVHWSPSSRTALAEAELEYPEKHTSRSIYVGFRVTAPAEALRALAADGPELPSPSGPRRPGPSRGTSPSR